MGRPKASFDLTEPEPVAATSSDASPSTQLFENLDRKASEQSIPQRYQGLLHSNNNSVVELNFLNKKTVDGSSTDLLEQSRERRNHQTFPSQDTSYSQDSNDSKKRHPNFYKQNEWHTRQKSDMSIVTKARENSRYFVRGDYSHRLKDVEDPYYYYSYSVPSSTTNSSNVSSFETTASTNQATPSPERLPDINLNRLEIGDLIMTEEDLQNINNEFPPDPNPFKRKIDYFNPFIYLTHYHYGQVFAVFAVFSILIFGSMGYLITVAKRYLSPVPPEVYEVLSPYSYPHLSAIRTSLVDPDTPKDALERSSLVNDDVWELVFSDEFNADGRTFFEGEDQFFNAVDIHYAATNDLEYYIPEMVETQNGSLQITLDAFPTNDLLYRSGMLQSWNQLCFSKNAIVEVSVKMPGYSQENGLWPAVWSLGNLARPGYQASTDGVWPYTYDECDYGITPNQSLPDGISFLPGQRLSKCTCYGEDHPNLGTGRGAPEIDLIEGFHNPNDKTSLGIQTLQVAPFDPWWRPDYDFMSIENSNITSMKPDTGTPLQEAIAAATILNDTWFHSIRNDSDNKQTISNPTYFQKYGFEYMSEKTLERDSYIQFFNADEPTMGLRGDALHPTNNIGWRQISKEPMSLVFNLGLSQTWLQVDFASLEFPAVFEIDYIRIYQPKNDDDIMTCNPHGYPTTDYIEQHQAAYQNVNFTTWEQAGFKNPRNSLMHHCKLPHGV